MESQTILCRIHFKQATYILDGDGHTAIIPYGEMDSEQVTLPLDNREFLQARVEWVMRHSSQCNGNLVLIHIIAAQEPLTINGKTTAPGSILWCDWRLIRTNSIVERYEACQLLQRSVKVWDTQGPGLQEFCQRLLPVAPWEVRQYGLY